MRDLKFMVRILIQTVEILGKNQIPGFLVGLREELAQKREEVAQRFNHNSEEFISIVNTLNHKYELHIDPEDLTETGSLVWNTIPFIERNNNNKSFSEISMRSGKNFESGKRDRVCEENVDIMIYLQACSLENMLEQLQARNEENTESKGNNNSLLEENNLSYNAELEKINEMSDEEERRTQNSIP